MSAHPRSVTQIGRYQNARKKSRDEVFHRLSRWYPSVSDTPEEAILLMVNGGGSSVSGAGSTLPPKSRVDQHVLRTESRVLSVLETPDVISESLTKPEGGKISKLLQFSMKE
ncbi:hypothetical protein EB796_015770 [Bugula neritina]|uniref:Uncharacterized protein n=1 Tax=Bugula neritina TaxID=10212 RepID=A0A7J7JJX3_BUGNE|nr:hypothetical protein EB796_015770 [Bugula neritina]